MSANHDRDVAQRRDVCRPSGRRSEQGTDLGDPAGVGDLVEEDVAPCPAAGIAVELLVDPRPGGVDEIHEWRTDLVGQFLHPGDLLERSAPPRARLDRVVVGDDARRPAVDLAHDGHHGVAGEPVVRSGEQAVFEVRVVVEQQAQAVADQQLALVDNPLAGLLRSTESGGLDALSELGVQVGSGMQRVGHVQASSAAIVSAAAILRRNVLTNVITVCSA